MRKSRFTEAQIVATLKELDAGTAANGGRCGPGADRKKRLGPSQRKEAVRALQEYRLSQVRACAIVGQPRRTLHYHGKPTADSALAERIQTLAQQRPRLGLAPRC